MLSSSDRPDAIKSTGADDPSWTTVLAGIPRYVLQPFSLSAVAVVGAILLGVFGAGWPAVLAALTASVLLLIVGLRGTPREAIGMLVSGSTFQPVSDISVSTPVERSGLTYGKGGSLTPLEAICFMHMYMREGGSVGRTNILRMDYFVDLMTASLISSHLEYMTHELTDHVRRNCRTDIVTTAASPKRGNSLLLAAVAREIGLEPLFVKERPLFGKAIEGIGGRPKKAVLIDDISSDGELLVQCVIVLRESGYEVNEALVLIDRVEGDARDALAAIGVKLLPMQSVSDQDLESIAARGRRRGPD